MIAGNAQTKYVGFRIDSTVRSAMLERSIPGLQMVVMKYGVVIKKGSYGIANLEDRVTVTDSSLFAVASLTRGVTSAAILLLMQDGKLALDDVLTKYLDSLPAAWSGITIRQLMNQTSGLPDERENADKDSGGFVLARIIAKVSGQSYAGFLKEKIFDRLGMKNSRINDLREIIPNRVAGYRLQDQQLLNGSNFSVDSQSGADPVMLTNLTDLLKWSAALQDTILLKKSSLDSMFAPALLRDGSTIAAGLGWYLTPYRDHRLISMQGSIKSGFNSSMEIYPEDGVCIIILSNFYQSETAQISKDILGLFSSDYARASRMPLMDDPDSTLTAMLKRFYTGLGQNLDSTQRIMKQLHVAFYPGDEKDLMPFRDVDSFRFVRSLLISKPKRNIFGDEVAAVYLYEVKGSNQPLRFYAFSLNPEGRVVFMDPEE